MRKFAAALALFSFFPCGMLAARLMLRDGTVIYGQFLSGSPQTIVFQDDTGMRRRFDINQIQTLDFTPLNSGADRQYRPDQPYPVRDRDYRADNGPRFAVLQPGTRISVRADQDIDAESAQPGQAYPASIAQDVVGSDGQIVIPRGVPATLVVRQVNEGGTFSGGSLALDLDTVRVNGRQYRIAAADVDAGNQGIGRNKRTAEMVGGGAVLGTLLGAIAGGGKGAAIGAVAGGVAGGGVEVLTKGRRIRVPAETVLNFRLDQPLELRELQ